MVKRMLIDAAHPEEIRVVVIDGNRVEEFDFESATRKQIKGNIYLSKVTRVEPSLQAAFVDYGGNRHGFLAFNEIHPDYYRLPVADRQALLAREASQEVVSEPFVPADESVEEPGDESGDEGGEEEFAAEPADDRPAEGGVAEGPQRIEGGGGGAEGDLLLPAGGVEGEGAVPAAEMAQESAPQPAVPEDVATSAVIASAAFGDESRDGWSPPPADSDTETDQPTAADQAAAAEDSAVAEGEAMAAPEDVVGDTQPMVEAVGGDDEVEEVERQRRFRFARQYKIQEVVKRRQVMLVQVVKEERGTKGAALTTYLSLAGRYCVLMPNTARGGGISRRISSPSDRKRLKAIMDELAVPEGMAVIVRTAGLERSKAEIKRDYEYLLRLWDEIRELTLRSSAPTLVYEEASLIKRAIRDLYARDIEEILVEGEEAYKAARAYMKALTPSHVGRVQLYHDPAVPLFQRFQVEQQLDEIHGPAVRLRSGGSIVINPTEALVAIDVNSGRSTRERHIEETALKTNLEAADEVARQVRLRDLAGLIVIDFIDMEERRNQASVERRLKEAMKSDRARIQIGRISPFGLLELSRQRLRPSLFEVAYDRCPVCSGAGYTRSVESMALHVLRGIEEEGTKLRSREISVAVATPVALYLLNHKRQRLSEIESRYGLSVVIGGDESLTPPAYRMDRVALRAPEEGAPVTAPVRAGMEMAPEREEEAPVPVPLRGPDHSHVREVLPAAIAEVEAEEEPVGAAAGDERGGEDEAGRRRRRRRRRRRGRAGEARPPEAAVAEAPVEDGEGEPEEAERPFLYGPGHDPGGPAERLGDLPELAAESGNGGDRKRRRSRRGGRRRGRGTEAPGERLPFELEADPAALPLAGPGDGGEQPTIHEWPWNLPRFEEVAAAPTGEEMPLAASEMIGDSGEPVAGPGVAVEPTPPEAAASAPEPPPVAEAAPVEAPPVAPPAPELPAAEMPAAEMPAAEMPAAEMPVAEMPVTAEAPALEMPPPEDIEIPEVGAPPPQRQDEPSPAVIEAVAAAPAEERPAGPPRKGWWRRITGTES